MKKNIICLLLAIMMVGAGLARADNQAETAGPVATTEVTADTRTDQIIRATWEKLYSAQFSEDTPGCSFDYGPNGMRNIYCYFSKVISYTDLLRTAGLEPFVSGPHTNHQLNLTAQNSFGHYNPEFVKWMTNHLIPAAGDEDFKWISDPLYQRYLKRTARTYYLLAEHLFADNNRALLERAVDKYRQAMDGRGLDYVVFPEVSELFLKDYIDAYLDADYYYYNVVDAAAGFWLRRYIDGTWTLFQKGLTKLLTTYDHDFLDSLGDLPSTTPTSANSQDPNMILSDDPIFKKFLAELRVAMEQHDWKSVLIFFDPENYREQTKAGQTTPRYIMEGLGLGWADNQLIPLPDDNSEYSLLNSIEKVTIDKVGPPEVDGLFVVSGQVTLWDNSIRRLELQMIRTSTGGYFIVPALG